ncbi:MAG TPA: hypothetical protein PLE50_06645, partial [Rhabdaerophilum sp.]|nr:hypothetical protein [Rhabdaerophilum sp.]
MREFRNSEANRLGLPLPSDDAGLREDEDALEPDLFDIMIDERLEEQAGEAPLDPEGGDDKPEDGDGRR